MKTLLFLLLLTFPVSVFAQKTIKSPLIKYQIQPRSNDSLRLEIHRNERLDIDFKLTASGFRQSLLTPFIIAGAPALLPNTNRENADLKHRNRAQSIQIGLLGSLVSLNPFKGKSRVNAYFEVKQYDIQGKLLRTGRLIRQPKSDHYKLSQTFDRDGFLVIKIHNFGKQRMRVKTNANSTAAFSPKDTTVFGGGGNSGTENDEPIAWENDLDGVTIVGTGTFNNNNFIASYEAAFGPSETWTAVSAGGGDGSGGSGGGGGSSEPPSAEAKEMARQLKKAKANKCEAEYIIEHFLDKPEMGPVLAIARLSVEIYMDTHGMQNANIIGTSKENAFKHALISAMMYCDLGDQHATAIASLHETCYEKNMNETEAERSMDEYNNKKGREIAASAGCTLDYGNIINAIYTAYHNGTFHDINGNKIY